MTQVTWGKSASAIAGAGSTSPVPEIFSPRVCGAFVGPGAAVDRHPKMLS